MMFLLKDAPLEVVTVKTVESLAPALTSAAVRTTLLPSRSTDTTPSLAVVAVETCSLKERASFDSFNSIETAPVSSTFAS